MAYEMRSNERSSSAIKRLIYHKQLFHADKLVFSRSSIQIGRKQIPLTKFLNKNPTFLFPTKFIFVEFDWLNMFPIELT